MDKEKYRSPDWQENKLKELYYAFGTSEEEGLKLFLNLVLELQYNNPSFLEKVYSAIDEIQQEGIYEVTDKTLEWVEFWKSYNKWDNEKNPAQLEKLEQLKNINYLSSENLGRLFFEMGYIENELKNFKKAAANYRECIRLIPEWAWTYYNLGIVYFDLGKKNEAIDFYHKAIEKDPQDADPHYGLGYIYEDLGKIDKAISEYQKAIKLNPKFVYPYYRLGEIYFDLDRCTDAIAAYQRAIELEPDDPALYHVLGYLFLKQGQLQQARAHLELAIALDANDYVAIINLGITYLHSKDRKNAQAQFRSALEKCPLDSVHGRINKVTALLGLEQNEEALKLLQQTKENFNIHPDEIKGVFTDWNLLANSPQPPAGIGEFLERAKEILEP